ncbi:tubulin--tyrosine ligase-like protein 12 [Leptopilina boulardi]|uniref:tubulin--tyrosine ligase-like protein 12 n=1 Tax=Leptopilina boulardi TaxID=63433 RepID=UPI0021F6005A|nr:tubulin--tyrosine ligase-like protein 12 [Leptopilina boulardi]XP_051166611.1 tubulin--tyrosine ligase-like protein 12 [Leptopilina boulardi]XP_051166612.1 tubulin--tyrosine ligase-like protein 12 [Leptopilina boulardi]
MDEAEHFKSFLTIHQPQLESSGVPKYFWSTIHEKLKNQIFDAGDAFQLARISYEDDERCPTDPFWKLFVTLENGILFQEPNNIYLIDHAWTYRYSDAMNDLRENPGLLERMYNFMKPEWSKTESDEEKIEFILTEMWRYNNFFTLHTNSTKIEDAMPFWCIMDEVGSSINHSDEPNFRIVPFYHASENMNYTLLFPIKNVKSGDEVTRNFIEGQTNDADKHRALLLPWRDDNFLEENFEQTEPDENYFLSSRIAETLPEKIIENISHNKLKVYSEYDIVCKFLNDPSFEIVDNEEEANVLWLLGHIKNYRELSVERPHLFLNQFPFEFVLTIKDLLSIVCRRKAEGQYNKETLETFPKWLPTTFNLSTELVKFVAYYQNREAKQLENHWICKPWNLARGLDTYVTKDLFHILRLPATGPKIAQKYITNPVLFDRMEIGKVKFDIRYVVLLKSVNPLECFAYSNFFLRFANKPFALNNFQDYEQHFTVMNYSTKTPLCHIKCADFIIKWENQYPNYPWTTKVEPMILKMLKDVFEAATSMEPPRGIAESSQSRAVYAVDMMLEWRENEMQPVLLEFNFQPDCQRACEYYPDFYNDIFRCLFLNDCNKNVFYEL